MLKCLHMQTFSTEHCSTIVPLLCEPPETNKQSLCSNFQPGLRAAERHDPGRQHEGAPGPHDYPDRARSKWLSVTHFSTQPSSQVSRSERLLFNGSIHAIHSSGGGGRGITLQVL